MMRPPRFLWGWGGGGSYTNKVGVIYSNMFVAVKETTGELKLFSYLLAVGFYFLYSDVKNLEIFFNAYHF